MLSQILQVGSISIPFEEDVRWAVERFAAGADLADMLHIVGSRGADAFLSFERRLGTLAGGDAPVPVERLP